MMIYSVLKVVLVAIAVITVICVIKGGREE